MTNSAEEWTRVPTTAAAAFGITLPYRPPRSAFGRFVWRKRIWFETTVGLSVLEPWEKILVIFVMYLLLTLVFTGVYKFVPQNVALVRRRSAYYFLGHEAAARADSWVAANISGQVQL